VSFLCPVRQPLFRRHRRCPARRFGRKPDTCRHRHTATAGVPRRPLGNHCWWRPRGVGKTELARAVARATSGSGLVRRSATRAVDEARAL